MKFNKPLSDKRWYLTAALIIGVLTAVIVGVSVWLDPNWLASVPQFMTLVVAALTAVSVIVAIPAALVQIRQGQPSATLAPATPAALPDPTPPLPAGWFIKHPYGQHPHFTGRMAEQQTLNEWLRDREHPLLLVRAHGGFGKSALVWHWLTHTVKDKKAEKTKTLRWPQVVWWSFYEGQGSFDEFLSETLRYLRPATPLPPGAREQADLLRDTLRERPDVLLILDGFERLLRAFSGLNAAYQGDAAPPPLRPVSSGAGEGPGVGAGDGADCVSPIADAFLRDLASLGRHAKGKVLLTTRLRPHSLERHGALLAGCTEMELAQLAPEDAVKFFQDQGIQGLPAEIREVCARYGHHPLSLRLLVGLLLTDPRDPGDIRAAQRLQIFGELKQNQHHVLEVAYRTLPPAQQTLLARLACFRSGISYAAIQALATASKQPWWRFWQRKPPLVPALPLDHHLTALLARGLLQRQRPPLTNNQSPITNPPSPITLYDLHPIIRHYAYDHLAPAARTATHTRLCDYFAAVPAPETPQTLNDLAPLIELYHHTVQAGRLEEAFELFHDRITQATYYQFGAYQLRIDLLHALFPEGDAAAGSRHLPRLKSPAAQAWTLNALAASYSLSGQPRRAVRLVEMHNQLQDKAGHKNNLATGLGNMADDQLKVGALRPAEANLRRRIALCRELGDEFREAVGHQELGRLLAYLGQWAEAVQELDTAWQLFEKQKVVQSQSVVAAHRALCALLLARAQPPSIEPTQSPVSSLQSPISNPQSAGLAQSLISNLKSPVSHAQQALNLAEERARTVRPNARDFIRAHWLLGAALSAAGQWAEAEPHLTEALQRCRANNTVEAEADILLDLARLQWAQGQQAEAHRLATEGLTIAERCGYVLQAADLHLLLAALDTPRALDHARAALRYATCDGEPYVYRVAYEEARKRVDEMGG